jgi:hypothetical protein
MLPGMPKHLTKVTFKKLWGLNESCDKYPMLPQQHGAAYFVLFRELYLNPEAQNIYFSFVPVLSCLLGISKSGFLYG